MNPQQEGFLKGIVNSVIHASIWALVWRMPKSVLVGLIAAGVLGMLYWLK